MVSYDLRIQVANSLGDRIKALKDKSTLTDEEKTTLLDLLNDLEIAGFEWVDEPE